MTTPFDEQPAQPGPIEDAPDASATDANMDTAPVANNETSDLSLAGEAMNLLSEHKGKLAIGVAATLGMMVYYGWREKRLAKTDPEEYARLQRLKAVVRHSDDQPKPRPARKSSAASQSGQQAAPAASASASEAAAADAPDQTDTRPDIS